MTSIALGAINLIWFATLLAGWCFDIYFSFKKGGRPLINIVNPNLGEDTDKNNFIGKNNDSGKKDDSTEKNIFLGFNQKDWEFWCIIIGGVSSIVGIVTGIVSILGKK